MSPFDNPAGDVVEAILLDPATASHVLRALMRDIRRQVRNGLPVPPWARPVLARLAEIADVAPSGSDSGTAVATVETADRLHMVPIKDAAADLDLSDTYVRRLAREGRVRAARINERAWVVDLDSLKSVTGRAA